MREVYGTLGELSRGRIEVCYEVYYRSELICYVISKTINKKVSWLRYGKINGENFSYFNFNEIEERIGVGMVLYDGEYIIKKSYNLGWREGFVKLGTVISNLL
jgi:hypothetical protein